MNILLVNILAKEKSTGKSIYDIYSYLKNRNNVLIAYGKGRHKGPNFYRIGNDFFYYIHNLIAKISGLNGYFSIIPTLLFIGKIKRFKPDLIHFGNLHSYYLNLPILFNYLSKLKIPLFFTLHDCWLFTGKCSHYTSVNCYKWKKNCNNCPLLNDYPESWLFDFTSFLHNQKKKFFSSLHNAHIIAVSNWVANQAKKSFLSKYPITTVYNWVDDKFISSLKNDNFDNYQNQLLTFPINSFRILAVSALWEKKSKRTLNLIELSKLIDKDSSILMVGKIKGNFNLPKNIISLPFIKDFSFLTYLYKTSDLYVHLSEEDTFGKVIAESISCGTPVVGFNSTAIPEVIGKECGLIAKKGDLIDFVSKINEIKSKGKYFYTQYCFNRSQELFNKEKNLKALQDLYLNS